MLGVPRVKHGAGFRYGKHLHSVFSNRHSRTAIYPTQGDRWIVHLGGMSGRYYVVCRKSESGRRRVLDAQVDADPAFGPCSDSEYRRRQTRGQ